VQANDKYWSLPAQTLNTGPSNPFTVLYERRHNIKRKPKKHQNYIKKKTGFYVSRSKIISNFMKVGITCLITKLKKKILPV